MKKSLFNVALCLNGLLLAAHPPALNRKEMAKKHLALIRNHKSSSGELISSGASLEKTIDVQRVIAWAIADIDRLMPYARAAASAQKTTNKPLSNKVWSKIPWDPNNFN